MENKEQLGEQIQVLNDVLSDTSVMSTENGDIFIYQIDEINNQIAIMQQKLAHIDCQILNDGKCTVHDYAGHDKMQEDIR